MDGFNFIRLVLPQPPGPVEETPFCGVDILFICKKSLLIEKNCHSLNTMSLIPVSKNSWGYCGKEQFSLGVQVNQDLREIIDTLFPFEHTKGIFRTVFGLF